ncbi:phosphatidate cytidylyltransferase [Solwaraspora sp. WMMB335]|uniref:phosphatidate cytidylyltransferase n=1 Tax=Solwaraspora sp. WMMB335 TaxID=3404118 RepID=UPI003B94609F
MSVPETAGGDYPDARTRARHPGAAPESSAPGTRNGHPAVERPDPPGWAGRTGPDAPAPAGPYTGTGEFPYAGPASGAGRFAGRAPSAETGYGAAAWTVASRPPAAPPADGATGRYLPDGATGRRSPEPDGAVGSPPRAGPESARRRATARRRTARPDAVDHAGAADHAGPTVSLGATADPDRGRADQAPAGTPDRASGRAGRNLPAAIGVGVGLVALVVGSLLLWRPAFLGVIVPAVSVGIWEMSRALRTSGARVPLPPLLAGGVLMTLLAWRIGPDALALGLLVTVLATLIWRLGDGPTGYQRDAAAATLVALYVPFLGGFAALLASRPDGDLQILATLAAVILSDTGGYAAGVFFGRHKMAPTVSPKKSWEGFAGSVAAAGAGSALLLFLFLDVMPWWGALFGVAVSIAAVLGDLGESMIKRDLRVKDMSNLLPGHGGLMDRLDSILFALPVSYLVLTLITPAG